METTQIPIQEYIDLLEIKLSFNTALIGISKSIEFNNTIELENAAITDKLDELINLL